MPTGRRILIVEDDPYTRDVLATALRGQGYDVVGVSRLMQGLEAARANPPHLLVVDIVLPDGSGVELARTLRAELPKHAQPIVVLMSAFSRGRLADQRAMREQAGAVAFVSKPVVVPQFLDLVTQHLPPSAPEAPDLRGLEPDPADRERRAPGPAAAARPGASHPPALESNGEAAPSEAAPPAPAGPPLAADPRGARPATGPAVGLLRALAAAWRRGWTGTLSLTRPAAEKQIIAEGGRIVWATTSLTGERLGRVALRLGWFPAEQYEPTLQEAARTGRRHGEVLVARGLITAAQLEEALREQVEQVVLGALAWPEGTYRLQAAAGRPRVSDRIAVSPIPRLVIRAFREVIDPDRLDAYLGAAEQRPIVRRSGVPPAAIGQLGLAPEEERFLAGLDAPLPLEAVLSTHPGGVEAARPLIGALLALGLLVPAGLPDGASLETAPPPAHPAGLAAGPQQRAAPPARGEGERRAGEAATARLLEAEAAFDAGRRAAEAGDLPAAQAALDRAVALCPEEGEYRAWAAWVRALAARTAFDRAIDRAIAEMEAAARLTPSCEAIFQLVERVLRLRRSAGDADADREYGE